MALFVGDASAPTRFGTDVADTTDNTGLFLKVFGGEVFAAFSETTHTASRHFVREISSGKSAQFPKTWKVDAAYHEAGQEMLGQDTDETERVITIDGLLVSHVGIYDLDEAMSHFQVRGKYTEELGRALARVFDTNVYRTVIKTARADTTLAGASSTTPFPDGQVILSANVTGTLGAASGGGAWFNAMRAMRVGAGGDDIPDDDRLCVAMPYATFDVLRYAQFNDTAGEPQMVINRDMMTANSTGPGSVQGTIWVDGIEVYRTNLLPQTDDSANGNIKAKYRADFSTTLACGYHPDGVGTVKLVGMGLEQTRDVRRQEDFIVAKIAVGHGPVRNEGTWEFRNT